MPYVCVGRGLVTERRQRGRGFCQTHVKLICRRPSRLDRNSHVLQSEHTQKSIRGQPPTAITSGRFAVRADRRNLRGSAFTLVELLVVIAVIGILIALL